MNESYSMKNTLKNNYVSLDSISDMIGDLADLEAEIFAGLDSLNLAPSQDTMNKIYAYL